MEARTENDSVDLLTGREGECAGADLEGGDEGKLIKRQAARPEGVEKRYGCSCGRGGFDGVGSEDGIVLEEVGGGDRIEDGAGIGRGVGGGGGGGGEEVADGEGEGGEGGLDEVGVDLVDVREMMAGSEKGRKQRWVLLERGLHRHGIQ